MVLYLSCLAYGQSTHPSTIQYALSDVITLAFFFLLQPSEFTGTDDKAFALSDVHLYVGNHNLAQSSCSDGYLHAAPSVRLHFTTQKNQGCCAGVIADGCSGHTHCCPVRAAED